MNKFLTILRVNLIAMILAFSYLTVTELYRNNQREAELTAYAKTLEM